jgi:hypothetical protein
MYNLNLKCNNYEICETRLPDLWGRTNYLCYNCDMMFGTCTLDGKKGKGTLEFYNNLECPICLENTRCVTQPHCNHNACINCFKRSYYGKKYPEFPYPELENEYNYDVNNNNYENNKKWDEYRHVINEYEILLEKIIDENDKESVINININKCILCKK